MKITADLFEAYLKCPTKWWLRAAGETSAGSTYSQWAKTQSHSYRMAEIERLFAALPNDQVVHSPDAGIVRSGKWRLASSVTLQAKMDSCVLESELHAVERLPDERRGKPAQFIPIRFVFSNKLSSDDKLLLAFDAYVLAKSLRRQVSQGKIIHGDNHTALKLNNSATASEVRKRIGKLAVLLSSPSPPDLVLNRHCPECEFQSRCRQEAVDNDDLSLLSSMAAKERKRFRDRGLFTVTQLSYTFRPRRRPKQLRDKREKYHHSLKALAIREKKIHIAGSPELKIEGTPVYVDVEGLPDRDFYYLIGVRIGVGDSAVQHSFWADTVEDEKRIWRQFLAILETVEKPVLIHYGSYETEFFRQAFKRYGVSAQEILERKGSQPCVNVLSEIFGQVYFPTQSNGLKEIATWLGFSWTPDAPIGANSVAVRHEWERSRLSTVKDRLVAYNLEDCLALEVVTEVLRRLRLPDPWNKSAKEPTEVVYVDSLKNGERRIGPFRSPFKEFEKLAKAAWWNYQRDRVYVKSATPRKEGTRGSKRERIGARNLAHFNKVITYPELTCCPVCGRKRITRARFTRTRTLYDLHFGRCAMKRWIAKYRFFHYWCANCERKVGEPSAF
jgi:predicted RecB family nuclease